MTFTVRPAAPGDADSTVPLIFDSGPAAFDFDFTRSGQATAGDFLRQAFLDDAGEFGFRNHVVAVQRPHDDAGEVRVMLPACNAS